MTYFLNREDKSDETLGRLTKSWNGKERSTFEQSKSQITKTRQEKNPVGLKEDKNRELLAIGEDDKPLEGKFYKSESESEAEVETNHSLSQRCDKLADSTLDRLSKEWSGEKPAIASSQIDEASCIPLENQDLAQTLSINDKNKVHHIDEEIAPSLLVDWKLWSIKIAIFILIPIFLVLGGGIKHIAVISPTIATYCHTQALLMQETVEGKTSLNAASNHFALAEIYFKQKESRLSLEHANKAAKIYAFDCMQRINRHTGGDWRQSIYTYVDLEPSLSNLRKCLILSARAAEQRGYTSLASTYWQHAVSLDPDVNTRLKDADELLANRMEASKSLAKEGRKLEAIKVLKKGFNVIPYKEARAIYYSYRFQKSTVTSDDINAYEKAIDLHQLIAKTHRRFHEYNKARLEKKTAQKLYKHLAAYKAIKELNAKWDLKLGFGSSYKATFYLQNEKIRGIYVRAKNYRDYKDQQFVQAKINEILNGNKVTFGYSKTPFLKFLEREHPYVRLNLILDQSGFRVDDYERNESIKSPYIESSLSNRYGTKNYHQILLNISNSL